jgi:hypothetical protein
LGGCRGARERADLLKRPAVGDPVDSLSNRELPELMLPRDLLRPAHPMGHLDAAPELFDLVSPAHGG